MSRSRKYVYREGKRISRGDIDRFDLLDQLLCGVSPNKFGIDVETNFISRVQRDIAWSHGVQEGLLAIVQPLDLARLSTMTYSR